MRMKTGFLNEQNSLLAIAAMNDAQWAMFLFGVATDLFGTMVVTPVLLCLLCLMRVVFYKLAFYNFKH